MHSSRIGYRGRSSFFLAVERQCYCMGGCWLGQIPAGSSRCGLVNKPTEIGHTSLAMSHVSSSQQANRQGGGTEPLHVSTPLALKSCPSTSPTHLGLCAIGWELSASTVLRDATHARAGASTGALRANSVCAKSVLWGRQDTRGYGATVARLTPDQKVGSSNLSALILPTRRIEGCGLQILWQRALEPPRSHFSRNARRIGK